MKKETGPSSYPQPCSATHRRNIVRVKVRVDGRSELGLDEAGCAALGEVQWVVGVDSDGDEICFLKFEHEA